MTITLVINHHSLSFENTVTSSFDESCTLLNAFFQTWQTVVNKEMCEKYIACDTQIWNWELGENKTMHDYSETLSRDALRFTHELLKITQKSSLEFFDEEVLEQVTGENSVTIDEIEVPILGCVCMADGAATLSLSTNKRWQSNSFQLTWKNNISSQETNDICQNFSSIEHVELYYKQLAADEDYNVEKLKELLPSVQSTTAFFTWFSKLNRATQSSIIKKAQLCEAQNWVPREDSPFKALTNTENNLTELRVWPIGKTLRVYCKKESDTNVIFLGGSDKDSQKEGIAKADKFYSDNY